MGTCRRAGMKTAPRSAHPFRLLPSFLLPTTPPPPFRQPTSACLQQAPRRRFTSRQRTSRFMGVGSSNRKNQWQARILVHGKVTHLGYYETEEEAARVYDRRVCVCARACIYVVGCICVCVQWMGCMGAVWMGGREG